jgi:formylglycine-generating enzyme required for sulfatase activity
MENVSWEEATAFCKESSYRAGKAVRLATEAEWEYACRAGTVTPFHFGTGLNGKQANCNGNSPYATHEKGPYKERTSEVGSYAPNAWGLYDMHGNVLEWCADWYKAEYAIEEKRDPIGPLNGELRVLRGGSWNYSSGACRAAYRGWGAPAYRNDHCGFRVVFRLD